MISYRGFDLDHKEGEEKIHGLILASSSLRSEIQSYRTSNFRPPRSKYMFQNEIILAKPINYENKFDEIQNQ